MRLGIGRLLRDIGKNPDIAFVVLQDEDGILTASGGVRSMSAIADDTLLLSALRSNKAHTRIVDYDGRKVFEVVKAMQQESGAVLLSRIGLSLERIREVQQRSMRRVIILAGGLLVAVVLLFGFLITRRQFSALERRHRRMSSSTDSILENIADAVVAIDEHGRITACNSAARSMLALGEAAREGDDYATLFPGDALLLEHTRRHGAIEYREIHYGASDTPRILAVSTSVVRTPEGAVDLLIAIARDLTEYRQALEQLQRKDKLTAMGELAGGIAHEIRNPLNAIGIIAQRFQHEFTPTEDAEEFVALAHTIRSEVQRVNGIVTQFLEFARPPRLHTERVDVAALLHDSIRVMESQARAQGTAISVIAEADVHAQLDRNRMQQALLNLVRNALDALGEGGEVKCVLCRMQGRIALTVADTGPGIPEEQRSRIFNLYFTTKANGTGLGLSIVHQIVSEHDGEITVTSSPGAGATFRMLLPDTSA
jgi:PAS domain S-box-containing protein